MHTDTSSIRAQAAQRHECTDHVIGAILTGWRYDISGVPSDLRVAYEDHLRGCQYCRGKQRLHRTIDVLLLAATTLSFAAFLLAALVMHRLEAISHITSLHVHLRPEDTTQRALEKIPAVVTFSLEAIALTGVVLSMLLWTVIAMVTPVPQIVSEKLRERLSPAWRNRLWTRA